MLAMMLALDDHRNYSKNLVEHSNEVNRRDYRRNTKDRRDSNKLNSVRL